MFNLGADLCVDLGVGLGVSLGVSLGMKAWNHCPIRGGLQLVKQWSMTSKLWSTCSNDLFIIIMPIAIDALFNTFPCGGEETSKHCPLTISMSLGRPLQLD